MRLKSSFTAFDDDDDDGDEEKKCISLEISYPFVLTAVGRTEGCGGFFFRYSVHYFIIKYKMEYCLINAIKNV